MKQHSPSAGSIHDDVLTYQLDGREVRLTLDSSAWFTWLDSATSFTFRSEEGHFTAHKTRAGNRRGGAYWRATRRSHGRLCSFYLGQSSKITLKRLREAARQLQARADETAPPPPAPASAFSVPLLESAPSLLHIKLSPPRLSLPHVPRPHLLAHLEQSTQRPITLVCAPAGSGKTTLLTEWVRTTTRPVAWLSLEAADNDPIRFLSYLAAAFSHLDQRIGQRARPIRPPAWEQVLTDLLNDLASMLKTDAVVILDDVQLLTAAEIHTLLQFFCAHLPSRLHLVIGTRLDPPLPLARLRAKGQLSELRAEALGFLSAEVEAFVAAMGLSLDEAATRLLEERTEGWIAGIQLLTLVLRGQADPLTFLHTPGRTHHFLLDYVSEEILAQQTPEMQRFLLRTSLLDRITGPLCEQVTGEPDGQARLLEAVRANLFVRELDETQTWYRYHPLFAEALRNQLQRQEPELIPLLYRRASSWYEQQHYHEEALEYALRAGDLPHAAALLEHLLPHLLGYGKLLSLERWLSQLPPSLISASPLLSLARILGTVMQSWSSRGSGNSAEQSLHSLRAYLDQQIQAQARKTASPWLPLLQAVAAWAQGDLEQTLSFARQISLAGPENSSSQLIALGRQMLLGTAYGASGDVEAAERIFLETVTTNAIEPASATGSFATFMLIDLYEAQGQLQKLGWLYNDLFRTWERQSEASPLLLALVQLRYASLLYEWNRLNEAEAAVQRGQELALHLETSIPGIALLSNQLQTRIALARGDSERAQHLLERNEFLLGKQSEDPQAHRTLGAIHARLALACGHLARAEQWATTCGLRFDDPLTIQVPGRDYVPYITLARILLARGKQQRSSPLLVQALILLEHLRAVVLERDARGWLVEVHILMALALQAQGKTKRALQVLDPALIQAEREGYVRLLVDEGQPMVHLLARMAADTSASASYLKLLQGAIEPTADASRSDPVCSVSQQSLPEPLSEREQEILLLLAEGLSNQQIAQRLVISVHTVKLHVRHILGKLTVTNRTQAVARARALDLL